MPSTETHNRRILPLSPDAIAQIHSSKHITSLQGIILSLLENSLDADSTKVDITVDWKRGSCTIEDNGTGIPPEEFAEHGGLGKMYCTSKPSPASTHLHGSSGIFLAELSFMSLLTITSTHGSNPQSASVTFHMARCIDRSLPESTQVQSAVLSRPGAHIAVHDLFGNMPVRLKHRALAASISSSDDSIWQDLKRGIVALLLAWPKPCSVKLRDADSSSKIVNISGLHTNLVPELNSKSLRRLVSSNLSASAYDPTDALAILFQSGFASPNSRTSWVPLSADTSAISLKGIICQDPAPTKQCQFLSLGVTPCSAADGHGEWYDCLNRMFSNSGFGIVEGDEAAPPRQGEQVPRRTHRQTATEKPRKGIDRYAMFCIQLKFKESHDPARLNEASLKIVEDVLKAAVTAWLEAHHFRPRKKRGGRRKNEEQESPARALALRKDTQSRTTSSLPATPVASTVPAADDSATRKRVTDIFGRPVTLDTSQSGGGVDELTALSRMRSGRPQSGVQSSRQTPAAPASTEFSRPFTAHDAVESQKRRRLQAPPIHVGQYSGLESRQPFNDRLQPRLHASQHEHPFFNPSPVPSSEESGSIDSTDLVIIADHVKSAAQLEVDETIPWTDLATGHVHRVNSRTGIVMPLSTDSHVNSTRSFSRDQRIALDTGALSSAGRPLSLSRRGVLAASSAPTTLSRSISTAGSETGAGFVDHSRDIEHAERWLPGFLREWNNPVFALRKEPPIPTASHLGPGLLLLSNDGSHHSCHSHADGTELHSKHKGITLSKNALRHARIIAQVDRKFILAVLPATAPSTVSLAIPATLSEPTQSDTLILIDQHAASERVMLEDLLEDLCTPAPAPNAQNTSPARVNHAQTGIMTVELESKLDFDIPWAEQIVLEKFRAWFLRWGIVYQLSAPPGPSKSGDMDPHPLAPVGVDHSTIPGLRVLDKRAKRSQDARIKLTHFPPCIAVRCSKEPELAIELIRGEVWRVAEHGVPRMSAIGKASHVGSGEDRSMDNQVDKSDDAHERSKPNNQTTTKPDDTPTWLPLLPLIPPGILSLLHSRACRSAIMFNDVLDHAACEELVGKLAGRVFPFVCAHGRVGIVPAGALDGTSLRTGGGVHGDDEDEGGRCEGERLAAWFKGKRK